MYTRIPISNQSGLKFQQNFSKTVFIPWSEIEMIIKKFPRDRSSHQKCTIKELFLKISRFSQESIELEPFYCKVASLKAFNSIKKRLKDMFSCEYCENFKNTYFQEHLWPAISEEKQWIICNMATNYGQYLFTSWQIHAKFQLLYKTEVEIKSWIFP